MKRSSHSHQGCRGFSLLELLVVIALIGILTALAVPALQSVSGAMNVSRAGEQLRDLIAQARQLALTHSLPAEVRIYALPKPANGTTNNSLCAAQVFLWDTGTSSWKAQGRVAHFPQNILVSPTVTASPLLSMERNPELGDPPISGNGVAYKYRRVGFLSGGRFDTSTPQAAGTYLTTASERDIGTLPPQNYSLIHVDEVTGRTRIFRPE